MLLPVAEGLSQAKWLHFSAKPRALNDLEMFDRASRGPWGAFLFPWHFRALDLTALLGELIMVSSLATEPFGQ